MNLRQAKALKTGQIVHYTGRGPCGKNNAVIRVKVNGAVLTWKRDPDRVKVPVKRGLYEYTYITESNLSDWHIETDCPLFENPIDAEEEHPDG